jgi:hypothetical protein
MRSRFWMTFPPGAGRIWRCVDSHPNLRLIVSKVSQYAGLTELVAQSQCVYHLAAAVGVELVMTSGLRTIETNLRETEVILDAASAERLPDIVDIDLRGLWQEPAGGIFRGGRPADRAAALEPMELRLLQVDG